MDAPILITGCARSGTSMIAGAINMCGAFGGKMSGPTNNNQKGMFENAKIRNDVVKPYLRRCDVDHLGQYPLPDVDNMTIPRGWQHDVETVIREQGYTTGPWMYKGAKMCLMWPVWHYAFPTAKWVIVRRKTSDIVRSCMHTGFMRAFHNTSNCMAVGAKDEQEGWLWWIHQHEQRFVEMFQAGLNVKVVWPERLVDRDYSQLQETIEWLGLEWTDDIFKFIEPKLWHSRQPKKREEA